MEIVGIVEGVFTDKDTGEVTKRIPRTENHIQDWVLNSTASSGGFSGQDLAITDMVITEQTRTMSRIPKHRAGNIIAGLPNNESTYAFQPGVHLYKTARQFDPPATDYTITAASVVYKAASTVRAKGFVVFDTPCVQTTTEILTLYYQIQVRYDKDWFTNPDQNIMTDREAWFLHQYMLGITPLAQPATRGNAITTINPRKLKVSQESQTVTSNTNLAVTGSMRAGIRSNYDIGDNIGQLFNSVGTSSSAFCYPIENVPNAPVQGIFSHNSAATKPFYDAATGASGTGGLAIVADSNYIPKPFAEYVKINITSTGQNGIASYNYSVRSSTGFLGNTFTAKKVICPILANSALTKDIALYQSPTSSDASNYYVPLAYDKFKVLMINLDKIFIVNTIGIDATALDSDFIIPGDVNPRFLPTNIVDVKVTASKGIWVACKNTALYYLSADLLTLNVFDTAATGLTGVTGCSGVDIGFGGRIWAYFQHPTDTGIYYSDNNGTSWTYTNSGVVGSATENVSLFADPSTADGHLLLNYVSGAEMKARWWNNSTSTNSDAGGTKSSLSCVLFSGNSVFAAGRTVAVSANGVWATSNYHSGTSIGCIMIFGTMTRSGSTYNALNQSPIGLDVDKDGNPVFLTQANGNLGPSLIKEDGTLHILTHDTVNNYNQHVVHLTDGIWLTKVYFPQYQKYTLQATSRDPVDSWSTSPFRDFIWKDYGWNGVSWVRDFVGNKATHTAAEELFPGVTAAFNDHSGAVDSYTDTDSYTFGLYDGVWMDGSTSFSFDNYMFVKPTAKHTSVEVSPLPNILVNVPYTPFTPTVPVALWSDVTVYIGSSIRAGRTTDAKLICTTPQYIDNNKIYLHNENNIKATATIKMPPSTGYFAIVRSTALGTAFDVTTVPFGLDIISGGSGHIVRAYENGVIKGSIDYIAITTTYLRITITNAREIVMEVGQHDSWHLVYKSPINTVILADYHLEFSTNGSLDPGLPDTCFYNSVVPNTSDLYIYLGNGLNEGAFATDFYRIDDVNIKIFIDGVEAVNVGSNDTASILVANSYSIFPDNAMIRFSPSDVGKTITAEYITLTDT